MTIAAGFMSLLGLQVEWMGFLGLAVFAVGVFWLPTDSTHTLSILGACLVFLGGFFGLARLGLVGLFAPGVANPNVPRASLDQYLIVMVAFVATGLILIGLDIARDTSRALPSRLAPLLAGAVLPVLLLEILRSGVGFVLAGVSWLPCALLVFSRRGAAPR